MAGRMQLVERRLTRGEALAALGGAVLLVAMFLDWFGVRISASGLRGAEAIARQSGGTNAWQAFELIDLALLLALGVAIAQGAGRLTGGLPTMPLRPGVVVAVAGGAALVLALVGLTDPPVEEGRFAGGVVVEASHEPGAFLGLAACVAILVGGALAARERGPESSRR